ncbi:hypothetical protein PanWU01x14_140500 [Parasponia andersonii]|uniref:Uncharacterized protein n=1 Tax=Parasponia andersonii TaxID=3476 RepID=A0A2P5CLY1_PARAD|nr:hypothetical protein PanWU01x14_140500 [Parasponia andersonii]
MHKQILSTGLRPLGTEEQADEGSLHAFDEHSLQNLRQVHVSGYQVQFPEGKRGGIEDWIRKERWRVPLLWMRSWPLTQDEHQLSADAVFESLQSRAALEKEKMMKKKKLEDEEEDVAVIKSVVFRISTRITTPRFHDDDEVVATKPVVDETCNAEKPVQSSQFMLVTKNKKKPRVDDDEKKRTSLIALQSLCDNYNSEDEDDDSK